jgi:exopolysaccharide biosynthesis protein
VKIIYFLIYLLWGVFPLEAAIAYKVWTKPLNQTVHVLEIDPQKYQVLLVKAKESGTGLETVQSMQARYGSMAGVNGGFFKSNGSPAGALKIDGQWYTGAADERGAVAWNAGGKDCHFGRFTVGFHLHSKGKEIPIDALNTPLEEGQVVMYTPVYALSTLTTPAAKELVIKDGIILEVRKGGRRAEIPQNSIVIAFGRNQLAQIEDLKEGDKAELIEKYSDEVWGKYKNILGGAPLLIENGIIVEDISKENVHSTFLELRHPRTALGVKKNGSWLFVLVEGRKLGQSKGATIKELAEYMKELGCQYALNLDGGSSSTFVVENKEIKGAHGSVSELVSNAVLIIPK